MGCAIIFHVGQTLMAEGAKVILYIIECQLYKEVDCACKSMNLNFISDIKRKDDKFVTVKALPKLTGGSQPPVKQYRYKICMRSAAFR